MERERERECVCMWKREGKREREREREKGGERVIEKRDFIGFFPTKLHFNE